MPVEAIKEEECLMALESGRTWYYTLGEALEGSAAPQLVLRTLELVTVPYWSFDRRVLEGQLVVSREVAQDVREIFSALSRLQFPIAQIVPAAAFGWSDERMMMANNTSAFNYRRIAGTQTLSKHSWGRAVDINPRQNPCFGADGRSSPCGALYASTQPGTLVAGSEALGIWSARGWLWGGTWNPPDYHHFEKSE